MLVVVGGSPWWVALGLALVGAPPRSYEGVTGVPEPSRPGPTVARGPASPPPREAEPAPVAPPPRDAAPRDAAPRARSAEPDAESPTDDRTLTVGAFVDTAYLLNTNFPDNHLYRGAFTTPRTGEFTVNLAVAYVDHPAVKREPWRVQVALQAGASADAVWAEEPVPGGDDGALAGPEVWKHIGLANAGGLIPSTGTEIFGGIMAAPFGIGSLWSKDNWNYSPSWMANGSPYYLAGAAVRQPLPAGFGLYGWVINGWQTVGDANRAPSYLTGLTWGRGDLSAATAVLFGPETADLSPRAWRMLSDTTLAWNTERIGVAGIVDVGRERVTTLPSESVALWVGTGVFVRGRPWQARRAALELSARPEAFWDRDGRIYGISQTLASATGTVGLELFSRLLLRLEYRYDHSTARGGFFYAGQSTNPSASGLAREQHTVFFSLVGHLAHAFALPAPRSRAGRSL